VSDLNKLPAGDFEKYLYDTIAVHHPETAPDVEAVRPPEAMQMLGTTPIGLAAMVANRKVPRPRRVGYGRVAWIKRELAALTQPV